MQHKLGICLAGGGARGIAHIGALQALLEADIRPECVSGSSMGALVGTLYAAGYEPQSMLSIVKESSLTKLFKFSFVGGLTDNSYLIELLSEYVSKDDFSSLLRPLYVCVTNMSLGRYEIVDAGPLFEMVAASASIPILFKPRTINGFEYADGGLMNNLPVEPLRERCEKVIGVNVTPIAPFPTDEGLSEIAYRTLDLVLWTNVEPRRGLCDVIVEPDTAKYRFFDIGEADAIYQHGYEAMQAKIPDLLKLL
ncbi:MAG: patatin-like phospholipase family protein [Bacteroidota bacterium]